jgi:hypothetical protein
MIKGIVMVEQVRARAVQVTERLIETQDLAGLVILAAVMVGVTVLVHEIPAWWRWRIK